ncbi:hypothetical protein [Pantoea stewartii]|uniref:Transposase n=1 Tax=Pantoea stewartii subsp. stewartii DC283 TaxID=660596 RepID=H3RLK1_PANSE|nr:hypothetical protein [Pantoea stewartii]ARF52760.1 hypothetical protein DSJ_26485 [Pantoea stewartii subsp. stewartii DC283]EHT97714.1 hypothetical protein CKS_5575 [Pantoea stewartii subsp. stewartii DC283]KAB0554006.1 hypothetical protein F7Q90_12515 [Pantoea stewartii subsp. stewartii]
MKHTKRRLVSPMAVGYVSHVLSQRVGLKVFRELYRHHHSEDRHITALALVKARRAIRAAAAEWQVVLDAEKRHVTQIREWNAPSNRRGRGGIEKG